MSLEISDLQTPALIVDAAQLEHNLATMAAVLPGARLRPHVKAHKCSALARQQAALCLSGRRSLLHKLGQQCKLIQGSLCL